MARQSGPAWRPWLCWSLASVFAGSALAVLISGTDIWLLPVLLALAALFAIREIIEARRRRWLASAITLLMCMAAEGGVFAWRAYRSTPRAVRLFAECIPEHGPVVAKDRLNVLYLWPIPPESGGGGLGQVSGGMIANGPLQAIRCEVINYGGNPIFNVSMALQLTFRESVKTDTGLRSGEVTVNRDWVIDIPRIDPGPNAPYVFYAVNQSPQWAHLALPDSARLELPGENQQVLARVTHPRQLPMMLPPQANTKP